MSPSTSVVGGTTVELLQGNPPLYANLPHHASHHRGQLGLRRATAERCERGLAVLSMERVAGGDLDAVSQAMEVTMKNSLASNEFKLPILHSGGGYIHECCSRYC